MKVPAESTMIYYMVYLSACDQMHSGRKKQAKPKHTAGRIQWEPDLDPTEMLLNESVWKTGPEFLLDAAQV